MTKKQLADIIAEEARMTGQFAERIVQTVLDSMTSASESRDGCPGAGTQGDCLEDGEGVEGENPCFINTSKTQ